MPLLTVSMPCDPGALPLLPDAARSVLAQDVDLHLVVIGDGCPRGSVTEALGALADDKRVAVFEISHARGRYFADAVVYAATDSPLFTIHDSDDTSEPGRYTRMIGLLDSTGADVVAPGVAHHWLSGVTDEEPPRMPERGDRTIHPWNNCALYRREALRGLMRPDHKIGYDTFLAHILSRTATVHLDPVCDYHWVQRQGSLTQAAATGPNSQTRRRMRAHVAQMVRRLSAQRPARLTLRRVLTLMPPIPRHLTTEVERYAHSLREQLQGPPAPVDASDIVLTILTGARPKLLEATLASVEQRVPGLLETAEVHVLVNGADQPTIDVVRKHRRPSWLIVSRVGAIASIGVATSWCAARALASEKPYWMHLEDDWEAHRAEGALDLARTLLAEHPEVSQVRLRQSSEGGYGGAAEQWSKSNMVTRQRLVWQEHPGWSYSPDCHLTQTPFLMRSGDAGDPYPARGESEAMAKWRAAGHLGIARTLPGIFTHLGDSDSLKKKTGCPR